MIAGWDDWCASVASRVGGFLTNTRRGNGFCEICTAPIDPHYDDCFQCGRMTVPRSELSDLVAPLAYGGHSPQSRILLYDYKRPYNVGADFHPFRNREEQTLFALLVVGAVIHRPCLEFGHATISALATVPSTKAGTSAPLVTLTEILAQLMGVPSIAVGYTGPAGDAARRFAPEHYHPRIDGSHALGHVLLVDDTWVSGARAESTASALKRDGTGRVTTLTVGRWLKRGQPPSNYFFDHADSLPPYNPAVCPVTAGSCPS